MRITATFFLLALLAVAVPLRAQTTFNVTVVPKTAAHPYFNEGHNEGYAIDGIEGRQLLLERGKTYIFQMQNVPSMHPFYLTTSDVGGGQGQYDVGVTGNRATGNQQLMFTPAATSPDFLFYQCAVHTYMGWQILLTGTSGIEDQAAVATLAVAPNPCRDRSAVLVSARRSGPARVALVDMFGREAALLFEGELDADAPRNLVLAADGLASGSYDLVVATADGVRRERVMIAR